MHGNEGQWRVVAATSSIEEAQASYSARVARVTLEQQDRRTPFRWQSRVVELGPVIIATQEYGAGFTGTSVGGPEVHTMSFPLASIGGDATFGGLTQTVFRGQSTYLYSSSGSARFRWISHYRGLQLTISDHDLSTTLAALLGATVRAPFRFEPRLALDRGVGSALDRAVRFVSEEAIRDDGLLSTPVAARRFGEAILLQLINGQGHNYRERLARIDRAADARSVRVAAEYLEANLGRAVRITELAKAAGVSVRALQIGFQKHHGCTPAEFLRDRRLGEARRRLVEGGPDVSVAAVAKQCGFAHLGRFSAHFRARFGELPTATRARR